MTHTLRSLLILWLLLGVLSPCALAAPVVLFDESHAQQFLIGKSGPLDLSELAKSYRDLGYEVQSAREKLTSEALAAVDVLIISGAFMPLHKDELRAVMDFIKGGGGLAVLLHIAPPVGDLLHELDVDFTNGTLRETNGVIDGNPLDFWVSSLQPHPVTDGLSGFSIYGAWALLSTASHVKIVAETGERSWVDLDRNNRLSNYDVMQKFGVMAAGELGQGRYVILGDDAVFQNRFYDSDNRALSTSILKWLSPG